MRAWLSPVVLICWIEQLWATTASLDRSTHSALLSLPSDDTCTTVQSFGPGCGPADDGVQTNWLLPSFFVNWTTSLPLPGVVHVQVIPGHVVPTKLCVPRCTTTCLPCRRTPSAFRYWAMLACGVASIPG